MYRDMFGSLMFKWQHEPDKQAARHARRIANRLIYSNDSPSLSSSLPILSPSMMSLVRRVGGGLFQEGDDE